MRQTAHTAAAAPGGQPGTTATTKLRPPASPSPLLPRERLLTRLEEVRTRRLTTVVADAGFGKSTLLSAWAADVNCAWYSASPDDASLAAFARGIGDALRLRVPVLTADPAAAVTAAAGPGAEQDEPARARGFAAAVCEALQSELRRDLVLIVDDLHELEGSPGAVQVIESLCRQAPEHLHLVLVSRSELPFPIERLRGQGQVLELSGADLAFDREETRALLSTLIDDDDAETAAELQRATGGWPAAVRLAVESLRGVAPADRPAALDRIRLPEGPLIAYLAAEVFARERPEVEALVRTVAPLECFTADLCERLGIEHAARILPSLARRGLFVELQGSATGWYGLGSPVREFALSRNSVNDGRIEQVRVEAARWFEEHDEPEEALRCLTAAGVADEIARLLSSVGPRLLARGSVGVVLDAVACLPSGLRSPAVEQLAGEAFQIHGDWDEALRCFERSAGDRESLPAGLAWRMGLVRHLGGRLDEAFASYGRGDEDGEPRDVALLLAWRASAHWLRGEREACREDAERAFALATTAGDPQALAAAHTVLAMLAALEGDRGTNDAHYLRALAYAEQAGDVLQLIRVRTNRGSRHVEECAYEEAIAELDLALRLADLAGFAAFRALALNNRGEALARLGRFDEAVADLESARALYQRLGSRMVAYPLEKLAEVYRWRGQFALARGAYEEALAHAEAAGDLQSLVPSLSGLARVVVGEEPIEAQRLVDRAVSLAHGLNDVHVQLSAGWVALARRSREVAADFASRAAATARSRRDRAGLAESLELGVLAAPHPVREIARLEESAGIWREVGSPIGEARAELLQAILSGEAEDARRAEDTLRRLGAKGFRSTLALYLPLDDSGEVEVHSLGRFRVFRGGDPIPLAAWQSRKARDLFKMLVARRGRPIPRDALMEALWPDQSRAPLGNRLSVLLSTVRSVLDPEKRHRPDHFVAADRNAVWLQSDHFSVDVEAFLSAADAALARRRAGAADAHDLLVAAEASYTGDFFEDDAYEDWAIGVRERSRAAYTEVVRALARDAESRGDADAAMRFHFRILEGDPYDETAHLGLVGTLEAAGRHGEARRCFRTYCARMDEIGVESAPFPRVERRRPSETPF